MSLKKIHVTIKLRHFKIESETITNTGLLQKG